MSKSGSFSRTSSYSPTESADYNSLQQAVLKGSLDEARFASGNFSFISFYAKIFWRYLVESGEDVNAGLDPPLHIAIRRKDKLMTRLLLQAGADFDIKDSV